MAVSESKIREVGHDLFRRMKGEKPGLFDKAWWSGQILEWAMRDPTFKTEMFRFVDVYPVLTTPEEVARHLQEYLLRPGVNPPAVIKLALKGAGLGSLATRVAAGQIAKNLEGMARRFITGTDARDAMPALRDLRKNHQAFTVDLLGEATVSEAEAEAYAARYRDLIDGLADECAGWPADAKLSGRTADRGGNAAGGVPGSAGSTSANLETDDRGAIPRVNVSVKVSALYSQFDPLAFEQSVEAAARRLVPLCVRARERGVFINLDMEQRGYKELTYALFRRVLEDPALAGWEDAGVVVQAYLRDAEEDTRELIKWAKRTKRRITVRLVKGAYWDYETVRARLEGWPAPVWLDKGDTDACYERCADLLLDHHKHVRTAIGSHNLRSIAHAVATAERYGVPANGYEIQCLYGMAEPVKAACVARGLRVRVYAPVGELLPGMAYLVRRLLENTSNQSWLRMGFVEGAGEDALLAAPQPTNRGPWMAPPPPEETPVDAPPAFGNEPLRDFGDAEQRRRFGEAVAAELKSPARTVTPFVDGVALKPAQVIQRLDPSDGKTLVANVHLAGVTDAERALASARKAFPGWRDTPVRERARVAFRLAALMRRQRDKLAALLVREVGKTWREADGDVAEAIDFCELYAREALRLGAPRIVADLPGELDEQVGEPRGVALVIAPWNFPLAILAGMTIAALVTGNTVLMKPAEQSSAIAQRLYELAREAKVPADVLQFLPGRGEEIGAFLVAHPDVATIAFTGSLEVGLKIWQQAGITVPGQRSLKRVICEMGGKNAIVVDADADLDEAVNGIVQSAFGYAGQKCSACSRAIVVGDIYPAFVRRLVEATRSLTLGSAASPDTRVGPVVDAESQTRLLGQIDAARGRVKCVLGGEPRAGGYYVPPTIFADVPADDPLAQEELFGPILAVMPAPDFGAALALANGTRYALTGGVFSRSPVHLEQARREFRVGNLYLNRSITGALVGRQPFGGFRMSGGGTKAGGVGYLESFLDARIVTENTLRRGFAPSDE